jgi:pyridoxamine 5'-phosphate oxidase
MIKEELHADPFEQFSAWFRHTEQSTSKTEVNACSLATVSATGMPSARMVLLKDFSPSGFVFYSHYQSRKAKELMGNPQASILFYWPEVYRQVRIEGHIEKLRPDESDHYYHSRPLGSQIGAHVSPQSCVIPNRDFLIKRFEEFSKKYADQEIPRPSDWGGFKLMPNYFEFWEGQENRLHDRFRYQQRNNAWLIDRLAP